MGCTIYAHDLSSRVYTVDCATGSVDERFDLSKILADLGVGSLFDIACQGRTMWAVTSGGYFLKINLRTGSVTNVGPIGGFVNALAVSSTGIIYAAGSAVFMSIDPTTGAGTVIGPYGGYSSSGDIAFDCNDNLYGTVFASGGEQLARVDVATGNATLIGPTGINGIFGLTFSCCRLYGASGDGRILTMNTDSGAGTVIGRPGLAFGGMTTCCWSCGCGC